jgi:predicted nucleic acid-binding protein
LAVRCHYWDASALVKIVADDAAEASGRASVRAFFFEQALHYATSYSLAEALNVFKLKWLRHDISREVYFQDVREFFRLVVSSTEEDQVPISVQVLDQAERIMAEHALDFVDALQLVTVLRGKFSVLVGDSTSLFATADHDLAVAARKLGAQVWECHKEQAPGC